MNVMKTQSTNTLDRRAVVSKLLEHRNNALVVSGLGSTVWDCAAAGDSPLTFPVWGAMGAAAMTGLGIAIAQPKRPVAVITGDGEMLMGIGSLATIGASRPSNLCVFVLDNGVYLETGGQPTHSSGGVDLAGVATACGLNAQVVTTMDEVAALQSKLHRIDGPIFAQIKIAATKAPLVMPPRDGSYLKDRFRHALLGEAAFE
jgi:thiamine pyrophosphate-dependent acetolactate synthase large subunit-like protein